MDQKAMSEKVILITGANSGIGKSLTELMVSMGMKVVGIARRMDKLKTLAEELKSQPGKLIPLQCDLTNQMDIRNTSEWIEKNLGTVDILINSAAINIDLTIQNSNMEDWKKTLDVNLLGLIAMTKETLNMMKKKGMNNGMIVNMNDTCGMRMPTMLGGPMVPKGPMSPAYIASKSALTAFTENLRMELAQQESNIKVMSISPGLVETEMTTQWLKQNPRMALKPREVANAILFALQTPDTALVKELIITPLRETM
ncbi:farnesol dehydrogenase-like [Hylaeus volcanicus]|uniref:farnesol dehydrogenase-like n=1 Tax=Hylaeus volcanicus TaxID=313075 RepID=UPI0023B796DD|nr:farnesol dehydrogenase-like [Hylaeus volcanicus]